MFALKNIMSPSSIKPQYRPSIHTHKMINSIVTIPNFKSYHIKITNKDDWNTITNCLQTNCIPTFENLLTQIENNGNTNGARKVTELVQYSKIIQSTVIRALNDIESAKSSRTIQRDFIEGASSWYLSVKEVKTNVPNELISLEVTDSMENISICIDKFNQVVFNFTNSHLSK